MAETIWQQQFPRSKTLLSALHPPLRVAQWNLENFGAAPENAEGRHSITKIEGAARTIVSDLKAPDILCLQEIADDSGAANDGTVSARANMQKLIQAISALGGPTYRYSDVPPANNTDGGMPGANIRSGFLYNPARVELRSAPSVSETALAVAADNEVHLASNPALINPGAACFDHARKPLIGEFVDTQTHETYFISNVHFTSNPYLYNKPTAELKASGTDYGLFEKRFAQADAVAKFNEALLKEIHATDHVADAHVMILGDFNTVPLDEHGKISAVLKRFVDMGLYYASGLLPQDDYSHRINQYTARIDHCFTSPELGARLSEITRANVDQGDETHRISDHNPTVFAINPPKLIRKMEEPLRRATQNIASFIGF